MALNLDTLGLSSTVTASGITAPDYQTILTTITNYFYQIYGADAYLEPDGKDGQMIALVSLAIHDANNTAIACYNSFSPSTGLSEALTRNVKINGIARKAATNSTVDVTLTASTVVTVTNGSVKDSNNIIWNLPTSVTIPMEGITVTATCASTGPVAAVIGSVNQINTPTRGWTAVTNAAAATVGTAVETDAQLRLRQTQSVALPSLTPFDAVDGALANVTGVTRHKLYENDTGTVDSNGLPVHSLAAIVDGGDADVIAQTIRGKKGQGVSTFGTTAISASDTYGNPHTIYFSRSSNVPVYVSITIKAFSGYTTQVGEDMKTAIAAYINSLTIGDDVLLSRIYSPANLGVVSGGASRFYDITNLQIGKTAGSVAASNIVVAFNESASCTTSNITITVTA